MPEHVLTSLNAYLSKGDRPTKEVMDAVTKTNQDRNASLLTMDKAKILAYAERQGVDMANLPESEEDFWASVHIAISSVVSIPMGIRRASKRWLVERDLPSLDDGEIKL